MINRSWAPSQPPNLEASLYDDGSAYTHDMSYQQPTWRGGAGTQQYSAAFQTGPTHSEYLAASDASNQQANEARFHQLQSRFSMASQMPTDASGSSRVSTDIYSLPVDFASRYTSHPSPSGMSQSYQAFAVARSAHGHNAGGGLLDAYSPDNLPAQISPTDSSSRFLQGDASHHFQLHQQQPFHPQSPGLPPQSHQIYPDGSFIQPGPSGAAQFSAKRQRTHDEQFTSLDTGGDADLGPPREEAQRAKPGACGRCKNLKVKCEFRSDSDTCRRCLNGGHECIIPGRKKRRVPPKREHLLNQIREQAIEIQHLMQQLQGANRQGAKERSPPLSENPFSSDLGYAMLEQDDVSDFKNRADLQDWVSKAKESIEAFGGYIEIGTGSGARNLIEESDSSESDWEEGADLDSDDDERSAVGGYDQDNRWDEPTPVAMYSRPSPEEGGKKKEVASDRLATIPSQAAPFGLMANLSLRLTRNNKGEEGDKDEVGVVRGDYFRAPTPDPTQRVLDSGQQPPPILTRGIVTPEEVENLFHIYFQNINLSLSLLDPVLYTAHSTYYRSPFLFTVICAISSRHYTPRPELYVEAMKQAKLAAGTALITGPKTIETVHAYILLALNPSPVKKWEEDRSWIYLGLAIRVAVDLNLHIRSSAKPKNEIHARELLNRTRVWLNCFNLDRSTGSVYGKGPMLPNSDYVANHSGDWWKSSEYNMRGFDIHLCAYNADLRLLGNFRAKIHNDPEHPTGLNKEIDFEKLTSETDDQLVALRDHWLEIVDKNTDPDDRHARFRTGLTKLAYSYARLVVLSFGFQRSTSGKNDLDDNPFITRCWRAANDVCSVLLDDLNIPEQRIYLRHGPEAQSVFVTFAAAFLVKLLHPKFITCFSLEQRQGIYETVQRVAEALGSPEVAIDDYHGPKLYSRFLARLLETAKIDPTSAKKVLRLKTKSQSPRAFSDQPSSPGLSVVPSPALTSSLSLASSAPSDPYEHTTHLEQKYQSVQSLINDDQRQTSINMDVPEFFMAPLPFDKEMLQSMQSLTNSTSWSSMALPGWNWMGQLQDNDVEMGMAVPNSRVYPSAGQPMQ